MEIAEDMLVVRTRANKALPDTVCSKEGKNLLAQLTPVAQFPEAGVTVLQCRQAKERVSELRDNARAQFKKEKDLRFAGRVLREQNGEPVVYTENLFVKFVDSLDDQECQKILSQHRLVSKRALDYATNAYFVSPEDEAGLEIFKIANDLLAQEKVELCHPELIRQSSKRAISPRQWHLHETEVNGVFVNAHANVKEAWDTTKGENTIIAIIDDGVDLDHEEFAGSDKIVAPFDATLRSNDPSPKSSRDNHGTACAGVACANGDQRASGVAPKTKLMPIRLMSGLGSQAEADAFYWAADNDADVISCSWGPADGAWWNPNDAAHFRQVDIPDSTRLAIEYAIHNGRGGKGCVITWAAGNGNENVENDGYASYDKVIAVAACNDRNSRSVYSDFGASIWCCFPSNDIGHPPFNHPRPLTSGIWTTDRSGQDGYNPGELDPHSLPPGDDHGHYTATFGGTSSACPGVAGVAALILSANPSLTWHQVKEILKHSAERIDESGGTYNNTGHSPLYGYGRPDAGKAVHLALNGHTPGNEELIFKATTSGHLEATNAQKMYEVTLTSNARITLDGQSGIDFDLYIKRDSEPTTGDYDQRAWTPGADEILEVNPPNPGRYFILVRSYEGSGDFSLTVEYI